MKSLFLAASILLISSSAFLQNNPKVSEQSTRKAPQSNQVPDLPELHKIQRVTLSPSYSCRSVEDFQKGYAGTALFLTERSRRINGPQLLFDGACKSRDSFAVATAGDNLDTIADYGDIPLANLAPFDLFGRRSPDSPTALFTERVDVKLGHSYGVLINKRDVRGFFFFRVMAHIPNQKIELEYVVMDYQEIETKAESRGFDWTTRGYY